MRSLLLALLLLILTGCASSASSVDRLDTAAIAELNNDVNGSEGTIRLVSGEVRSGRLLAIHPEVVVFRVSGTTHVLPTPEVEQVTVDNRGTVVRNGALIGAGTRIAVELIDRASNNTPPIQVISLDFARLIATGALWGTLLGAAASRRHTYTFTGEARPQELPVTDPP